METKFKEDLVMKAVLGADLYEKVKKHIPAWHAEYLDGKHAPCSWNDFLTEKCAAHQTTQDWNVYQGDKKVGSTKANSEQEAIKKFASIFTGQLSARRTDAMQVRS